MDDFLLQSSEKNNDELKSLGSQMDMLLQAITKNGTGEELSSKIEKIEAKLENIATGSSLDVANQIVQNTLKKVKGEKGDKGDPGKEYTVDYDKIIKAAVKQIPVPKNGAKGNAGEDAEPVDYDKIARVIIREVKKIPAPKAGKDATIDYKKIVKEVVKSIPAQEVETMEELKARVEKAGVDYKSLDNAPPFEKWIDDLSSRVGRGIASKTVSLVELDDIDYSGLTITDGKYVLGSGGGSAGGGAWGDITGTLADQTDLQDALDLKQDILAEGAFVDGDKTKLDGIEALADKTDTANVTSAGAVMDSELASETDVKALDQSVVSGASPTFGTGSMTDASNKRFMTDAQETKIDYISVTQAVDLDQMETDIAALSNGMVYKGDWDASAGTFPGAGAAQTGWFYYVSVAGTVGGIAFVAGDNIVATTDNASTTVYAGNWSKHDQTDAVQSVAGKVGAVTLVEADITDFGTYSTATGVENNADVTDTANVTAAGALMDSELASETDVKALDQSVVNGASPVFDGSNFTNIPAGTVDVVSNVATARVLGRTTAGSGDSEELTASSVRTLINVEDGADVTDATNVQSAGALMDSELASETDVKALDQSVVSGAAPTFTNTNFTEATDKNYVTDAQQTVIGNTSNTNTGDEAAASLTVAGVIEISTGAETNTGTDATRAVSPDGLNDWTGSAQVTTLGTIGTGTWQGTAINATYLDGQSGTNTGDEATATDSAEGVVELATDAEMTTGTATNRAVTPANAKVELDKKLALGGGTMTGPITLGENTSVALDPAGSADGKYTGTTVTGTGGATIAFGDTVYLAVADSRWEKTDASAVATAGTPLVGIAVTSSTDGAAITVLLHGIIRADAKFPTFTVGAQVFLSETAGLLTNTAPTTADAVVRACGFAVTANEVYWNIDSSHITVTG